MVGVSMAGVSVRVGVVDVGRVVVSGVVNVRCAVGVAILTANVVGVAMSVVSTCYWLWYG